MEKKILGRLETIIILPVHQAVEGSNQFKLIGGGVASKNIVKGGRIE